MRQSQPLSRRRDEDQVRERFAAHSIAFERCIWLSRHPGPPAELLDRFRLCCGPAMNAFEVAKAGREEALHAGLAEP